jgi:short-subunit dehydrogenase
MTPVILITGATDGIGRETARVLARRGASVILHGRNEQRLEAAAAEIREEATGVFVGIVKADFSSLRQVRTHGTRITAAVRQARCSAE